MINSTIEIRMLEAATRRDLHIELEAKLHNISKDEAARIIRRLIKAGKLYNASTTKPNFWGGASGAYRSTSR
jgi:hypothetical protein